MGGGFSKEAKTTPRQSSLSILRLMVVSWDDFDNKEAVIQNLPIIFQTHDVGKLILSYLTPGEFLRVTQISRGLTVYRNDAISAPYAPHLQNANLFFWRFLSITAKKCAPRTRIDTGRIIKKILISQKHFQIITLQDGGVVRCWCLNTGVELPSFECHKKMPDRMIALTPDENYCVMRQTFSDSAQYFSMMDKKLVAEYQRYNFGVLSPEGLIALNDQQEIFFSNGTWIEISQKNGSYYLHGHTGSIFDVVCLSDTVIASCSGDRSIKIWDLQAKTCLFTLTGHSHNVYCLAFTSDKKILLSGSEDKTIKIWDMEKQACINTFTLQDVSRIKYLAVLERRNNGDHLIMAIVERDVVHGSTTSIAKIGLWNADNHQIRFINTYSFYHKITAFSVSAGFITLGFSNGDVKLARCCEVLFSQDSDDQSLCSVNCR